MHLRIIMHSSCVIFHRTGNTENNHINFQLTLNKKMFIVSAGCFRKNIVISKYSVRAEVKIIHSQRQKRKEPLVEIGKKNKNSNQWIPHQHPTEFHSMRRFTEHHFTSGINSMQKIWRSSWEGDRFYDDL